jgi:hypothetical protein
VRCTFAGDRFSVPGRSSLLVGMSLLSPVSWVLLQ